MIVSAFCPGFFKEKRLAVGFNVRIIASAPACVKRGSFVFARLFLYNRKHIIRAGKTCRKGMAYADRGSDA